jgi:crotonobetainyl-CoA:carnitine CoA-transferase CaiB-like acyl-CoA transferase
MSTLPLAGIRVLDLSRVLAGPYCAMVLADLGADVLKVERPTGGDETRSWGPPFAADGNSAYFMAANRNKRSITLDLMLAEDRAKFEDLVRRADVVVHNFPPRVAGQLRVDEHTIKSLNPDVILAAITGFGLGNSFSNQPGYDFLVQAMSGMMSITGEPSGSPIKLGVAITDIVAGLYAVIGILANLAGRARGQASSSIIDVSLMQSAVSALVNVAQASLISGNDSKRYGNAHPQIVPYQLFKTADSHVALAVGNDEQFRRLCQCVNIPQLASEVRFASNPNRIANREELVKVLQEQFIHRTTGDWVDLLAASDIPAGPVQTIQEMFNSKWARERGVVMRDDAALPHIQSPLAASFAMPATVKSAPRPGDSVIPADW